MATHLDVELVCGLLHANVRVRELAEHDIWVEDNLWRNVRW